MHHNFAVLAFVLFTFVISTTFAADKLYSTYISTSWDGTSHRNIMIRFNGNQGTATFGVYSQHGGFPAYSKRHFNLRGTDVGKITSVDIQEIGGPSSPPWRIRMILIRVGSSVFLFPFRKQITKSGWVRITMTCPRGFKRNSAGACEDIDECANTKSPCYGPHVTCRNTIGWFKCECPSGYYLKWGDRCEDINECGGIGRQCEHYCINTPGSYHCKCPRGHRVVDGFKCQDIDECAEANPCDPVSTTCSNHKGYYRCSCKPGYLYNNNDKNKCDVAYCFATSPGAKATFPAKCGHAKQNRYNDTCTQVCNYGYVPRDPSKMTITCDRYGRWQGYFTNCIGRPCPPLPPFPNGQYSYHERCTKTGGRYGDSCNRYCGQGYRIVGGGYINTCQIDGTWSGKPFKCEKTPPRPEISCPKMLSVKLAKGQSTIALGDDWKDATANVNNVSVVKPVGANRLYQFPCGSTYIQWVAVNKDGDSASCIWVVKVRDEEPPTITYCPGPKVFYATQNRTGFIPYNKPTFTDNVKVTQVTPTYTGGFKFVNTYPSGRLFTYTAYDAARNEAQCRFVIYTDGNRCRVPPNDSHLRGSWQRPVNHLIVRRCPSGMGFPGSPIRVCRKSDGKWALPPAIQFDAPIPDCVPIAKVNDSVACPANYVNHTGNCYACGRGTFYTDGKCQKCTTGTFQSRDAQSTCDTCPSGTSSVEGAFECRQLCPAGTFSRDGARPFCQLCPSGQYQPSTGRKSCLSCAQTTNTKYGATVCGGAVTSPAAAPVIDRIVTPGNVTSNQDNTLECYIRDNAYDQVSVTWKIEGSVPAEFLGVPRLTELTNPAGKPIGATLDIKKATFHNADLKYVCEATNPHGKTQKVVSLKWPYNG